MQDKNRWRKSLSTKSSQNQPAILCRNQGCSVVLFVFNVYSCFTVSLLNVSLILLKIKVLDKNIIVNEGETKEIRLLPTVPILCSHTQNCKLEIEVSVPKGDPNRCAKHQPKTNIVFEGNHYYIPLFKLRSQTLT